MNKIFLVTIAFLFIGTAQAQTNSALVTNYVTAADHFRCVNGQLYNTEKSELWKTISIRVTGREQGLVHASIITKRAVYESRWHPGNNMPSGSYGSSSGGWRRIAVGQETVIGKTILLKNAATSLSNGSEVKVRAMHVRNATYGTEVWDCGVVNRVAVSVTRRGENDSRALRKR